MKGFLSVFISVVLVASLSLGVVSISFAKEAKSGPEVYATPQEYQEVSGKKISRYNEAPTLKILVGQKKLPSIEKRLPNEPLVIDPIEEIGKYGGTLKKVIRGPANSYSWTVTSSEYLLRWQWKDGKLVVVPNIAKKWEVSEGGKVYTFYLRKGMKWSDGEPFTADDIMFWYEDIILNKDLTPSIPSWLIVGGKPGKIEKLDDYTVRFVFEKPYAILPEFLAFDGTVFAPKHYLKQFHPKYTSEETLDRITKEAKFDYWYQLFGNKNSSFRNPDIPVISAWKVTTPLPALRMIAERNPYYWKVDIRGNQLPYIDRVTFEDISDLEVITMRTLNGEFDMLDFEQAPFGNYTIYMENKEKGDYRVLRWIETNILSVYVNQNVKDPVLRKIFEDRRFRMALSYAINREEINALFFNGMGRIAQPVGGPGDPYFKEDFGKTAIEYNVKEANRLLDEMGLTKRDREGYRLRPDGKTLSVTIETWDAGYVANVEDLYQMIVNSWKDIGVKAAVKVQERSLWYKRAVGTGEVDLPGFACALVNWVLDYGLWYVPTSGSTYFAPLYGVWYATGGQGGEEPTGDIRRLQILYDQLKSTMDKKEQLRIGQEILSIHDKNLYIIGTVQAGFRPMVVKNKLRNVLEAAPADWRNKGDLIIWPEQMFFK